MKKYLILSLVLLFSGCSAPSVEKRVAKAKTLSEVVEVVTSKKPYAAKIDEKKDSLSIFFSDKNQTPHDHQALLVKALMPVLLKKYPKIDNFAFVFGDFDNSKNRDLFIIGMERSVTLEKVQWDKIKAADIERLSILYSFWPPFLF